MEGEGRKMKPRRSSITRLIYACKYSMDGLTQAYRDEAAFRQELLLFILLIPALILLPLPLALKMLLFSVNCLVLITELVNSSIEAVVDLASPQYQELAKKAKDMGSAAVFLSLGAAGTLWGISLFTLL